MTAIEAALGCIARAQIEGRPPVYLAVHEMDIIGHSQNALSTRLPEAAKLGKVHGRYRDGKKFKEWGPVVPA